MELFLTILAFILIIGAGAGGAYGGFRLAQWHYNMVIVSDLRKKVIDLLIKISAHLNLHYMLINISNSTTALKVARQRGYESLSLLAECESAIIALGGDSLLVKRLRELSTELEKFCRYCETTAIPSYSKLEPQLEIELGNVHSIVQKIVTDVRAQ